MPSCVSGYIYMLSDVKSSHYILHLFVFWEYPYTITILPFFFVFRLRLKLNFIIAFFVHWSGDNNGDVLLMKLQSVNSMFIQAKMGYISVMTCPDN